MKRYKINYNPYKKLWQVLYVNLTASSYEVIEECFEHKRISECYAWLKAVQEGLIIKNK